MTRQLHYYANAWGYGFALYEHGVLKETRSRGAGETGQFCTPDDLWALSVATLRRKAEAELRDICRDYGLDLSQTFYSKEMEHAVQQTSPAWRPRLETPEAKIERLETWIKDLLGDKTVNCVYCGHAYGPDPGTPVAMAEVLERHIEACPDHPLAKLRARLPELAKNAFIEGATSTPNPMAGTSATVIAQHAIAQAPGLVEKFLSAES